MAYVGIEKGSRRYEPSDRERMLCVAAICALALAPLAFCAAVTIWGA